MAEDIRIDLSWLSNLKTLRLSRDLGGNLSDPLVCLIRLWIYAADHHYKGVLTRMMPDDVESVAGWTGKRGDFFHALSRKDPDRSPWLEIDDEGNISIHQWEEHQPYVFHKDKRVEHARKMNDRRWEKKTGGTRTTRKKRSAPSRIPDGLPQGSQKDSQQDPTRRSLQDPPPPAPAPAPLAGQGRADSDSSSTPSPMVGDVPTPEDREKGHQTLKDALAKLEGKPMPTESQTSQGVGKEEQEEQGEPKREMTEEERTQATGEVDLVLQDLLELGVDPARAEKIHGAVLSYRTGESGAEDLSASLDAWTGDRREKIKILSIPGVCGPRGASDPTHG